jgi:peptide deformylase
MKLITSPDNFLQKTLPDFDFDNPIVDPSNLEEEMIVLMAEENGIGLSANQVGIDARVFVMFPRNIPEIHTPFALFNPRVLDVSLELEDDEEGCLSFPGLFFKVKRPKSIVVEFLDRARKSYILRLEGIDARCFLHELDHLNGICFTDRISKLKLDLALKKQRKKNGRTQR